MRSLAATLLFATALAHAEAPAESAWNEVTQSAAEVDSAKDCTLACRALESLARATKKLCDLGPDHCEEARAKLREATERVRATCPNCAAIETAGQAPPPPPPTVQSTSEAPRGGGCAGCSTSSGSRSAVALALLFLVRRRKKT